MNYGALHTQTLLPRPAFCFYDLVEDAGHDRRRQSGWIVHSRLQVHNGSELRTGPLLHVYSVYVYVYS